MSIDEYLRRVSAAVQESLAGLAPQQPTPEQRLRDLRDHFAGLAMQAYLGTPHADKVQEHTIAECSYSMADAMIAARGEQP